MIEATITDQKGQEKKELGAEEAQKLIARLTNWQRNQWAKAEYPAKYESDIIKFLEMKKPEEINTSMRVWPDSFYESLTPEQKEKLK